MAYRIAIVLLAVGFVVHRVALRWEIRKAHRSGDRKREEELRHRGFGLYRWALAAVGVLFVVLVVIVWSNSRGQ